VAREALPSGRRHRGIARADQARLERRDLGGHDGVLLGLGAALADGPDERIKLARVLGQGLGALGRGGEAGGERHFDSIWFCFPSRRRERKRERGKWNRRFKALGEF